MLEKPRITLHDVADLAGVSHQTVSRVINNIDNVRPETRERVEAAILELGYRPNAIARSMVKGSTHTLGCISPNLTDPVFAWIIESAQAEARRLGFFILTGSASNVEEVKPLLDELLNRRVDGLIVLNPRDDDRYKLLDTLPQNGSPIVYVKNSPIDEPVSSVRCDDVQGGYLATKHLIDLGHKKIAIILGPGNEQCTRERFDGYRTALEEANLKVDDQLIIQGNWSAQSGSDGIVDVLEDPGTFSAIFAQNDRMAAGAIRTLRERGYRVPDDYSIIGYDNGPLASLLDPPLTTIEQPLIEFGKQAARILINNIQGKVTEPVDYCASPDFILRQSTTIHQGNNQIVIPRR